MRLYCGQPIEVRLVGPATGLGDHRISFKNTTFQIGHIRPTSWLKEPLGKPVRAPKHGISRPPISSFFSICHRHALWPACSKVTYLPNFLKKIDSCSAWGARSAWGCTYNFPLKISFTPPPKKNIRPGEPPGYAYDSLSERQGWPLPPPIKDSAYVHPPGNGHRCLCEISFLPVRHVSSRAHPKMLLLLLLLCATPTLPSSTSRSHAQARHSATYHCQHTALLGSPANEWVISSQAGAQASGPPEVLLPSPSYLTKDAFFHTRLRQYRCTFGRET